MLAFCHTWLKYELKLTRTLVYASACKKRRSEKEACNFYWKLSNTNIFVQNWTQDLLIKGGATFWSGFIWISSSKNYTAYILLK